MNSSLYPRELEVLESVSGREANHIETYENHKLEEEKRLGFSTMYEHNSYIAITIINPPD